MSKPGRYTFYEFFAGGGMARLGLGPSWRCLFANDFDAKKAASYRANHGGDELVVEDVAKLRPADLPGAADLAWASFPCQDLSLAGAGAGLKGDRSGAFWPFWRLMRSLGREARAPRCVVLENVYGALISRGGRDFATILDALAAEGYAASAAVIDAALFVPQSRPCLFVFGFRGDSGIPDALRADGPNPLWHPAALQLAQLRSGAEAKARWMWLRLPEPPRRNSVFGDLIEDSPAGVRWHTEAETARLLAMMSPLNRRKVEAAARLRRRMAGAIYKRTRVHDGEKIQRAEIRFDDVAGCLRTPAGGSSRQSILVVEGERIRSRLLSAREAARLMGLPDDYRLPDNYNEAYHLAGDGVVAPVVRHLAATVIEPALSAPARRLAA